MFGTFVHKLKDEDLKGEPAKPRADAKSNLRELPTLEYALYMALSTACMLVWLVTANAAARGASVTSTTATLLAYTIGWGPVLLAVLFMLKSQGLKAVVDSFLWKQDKRAAVVPAALHFVLGSLMCSVPVVIMARLVF